MEQDAWYYLYIFLNSFVVSATVEEFAKVILVRCRCLPKPCCIQPRQSLKHHSYPLSARTTLVLLMSGSLGFATMESFLFTFGESCLTKGRALNLLNPHGYCCTSQVEATSRL